MVFIKLNTAQMRKGCVTDLLPREGLTRKNHLLPTVKMM